MKFPRLMWRRELLLLSVSLMEICWLYPWTTLLIRFTDEQQHNMSAPTLLIVLLLALYLTRILSGVDIPILIYRLVMVGGALLSVLAFLWLHFHARHQLIGWHWLVAMASHALDFSYRVPYEWPVFLLVSYLWWRGIGLAQSTLGTETVGFRFRWGIASYIWFHLANLVWGNSRDLYPLIFAFFFCGLVSVALARAEDVSQRHVGIHSPFNAGWLGILLGGTLLVLLLGGGLAAVLSVSGVSTILQWLHPILSILRAVLNAVIIALAYLLQPLMKFLIHLGQRFLGEQFMRDLGPEEQKLLELVPYDQQIALAPWYLQALKIVVLLAIIAVVLLAVFWTVNRRRQREAQGRPEERESVWSSANMGQDLIGALRGGLQRLKEGLASLGQRGSDWYSFTSVRRIYASLVRLATSAGYPRERSVTPYEYMSGLYETFPGNEPEVQTITEAYIRAHYGEVPFSEEELDRVREAGQRIMNRVNEQRAD
ncbi:MAG: DUF4129 domain-containing protein [Chloroflexota bacterium]